MFYTLLRHGWLSFVRAHYFERSLGIKLLFGFVIFISLWYLFMIGLALPNLLENLFPEQYPHEAFFSLLLFVYGSELLARLFFQKVPRQRAINYLHLPVKKSFLARYTLIRSWFSGYNFFLLVFLVPFFMRTLYGPVSPEAFRNALLGCFLLSALNHSVGMVIKTRTAWKPSTLLAAGLLIAGLILAGYFFLEQLMAFSGQLGLALMKGNMWVFAGLVAVIGFLQLTIVQGLVKSFYTLSDQSAKSTEASLSGSFMEKLLAKVPVYGIFWELEWKLITRNKRARNNFYQWPLMLPILVYLFVYSPGEAFASMTPILMLFLGSYGINHLQFAFSWESRFFDLLATQNMSLQLFIRAKYFFYSLMALLQFFILLPFILWLNPDVFPLFTGLLLFAIGPAFCLLFFSGVSNSTRIDPNGKSFFNLEGTSGRLFISVLSIFFTLVPVYIVAWLLPMETMMGFSLAAGVTGLLFIIFNKQWVQAITNRFERTKYRNLNKYREK